MFIYKRVSQCPFGAGFETRGGRWTAFVKLCILGIRRFFRELVRKQDR
jgi:hypothetical protein